MQTTSLWSFCDSTQKSSASLLGICASTQMNNFWSFCGYAQLLEREKVTLAPTIRRSSNTGVSASVRKKKKKKKLRASIRHLRIYANEYFLEFLRICTATGARKIHDTQIIQYWSFCDRTQKSSAPLLGICVSTQMKHFWSFCGYAQLLEREKVTPAHTIRRSIHPIMEFLRPYADTPNLEEISPEIWGLNPENKY